MRDQQLHDIGAAEHGCHHQRGLPGLIGSVDVAMLGE